MTIPWDSEYEISENEMSAICRSIAEFQKGESSEGIHLISQANEYEEQVGDVGYKASTIAFIKEEQRHARDLAKYMKLRGIPLAKSAWPDTVFRRLRRYSGIEISTCVLVTAEIIAQVYYPALRAATKDPVLIALCDQIIADEDYHVLFQAERIVDMRRADSFLRKLIAKLFQKILFAGTVWVVWIQHYRVFKNSGISMVSYSRRCWECYGRFSDKI